MTRQQIFVMYLANKNQMIRVPDEAEIGRLTVINTQGQCWYNNECDYPISDCQLILTPISEMSEEHKKELCSIVPMEQEDLEILTGGTMHLATLDDMVKITDFLKLNGYALDDSWFESQDGQLPIAVRGME